MFWKWKHNKIFIIEKWGQTRSWLSLVFFLDSDSLAHKSKNVYNLSDIWIRDHDVKIYFTGPAKFFTLQAQAIAGFSSCGEAACYPEILRI